jgi:uracil-DNA glycosylase
MSNVRIEESWKRALALEFEQPYFQAITTFVKKELAAGKTLYPPGPLIFNAFAQTPIDKVKVIILGQDPYHKPNQAMGLSFSVPKEVRTPPSLLNVYKALNTDLGLPMPTHGDLTAWAQQGVFLLNAILTVEDDIAGSHQKSGWQLFTDAVIKRLSDEKEHLVFMLWGNFAKQKGIYIDKTKHLVLTGVHPSPLAGTEFPKCTHFSEANKYLEQHGIAPIDWRVV